jgi:hypothetical protein
VVQDRRQRMAEVQVAVGRWSKAEDGFRHGADRGGLTAGACDPYRLLEGR